MLQEKLASYSRYGLAIAFLLFTTPFICPPLVLVIFWPGGFYRSSVPLSAKLLLAKSFTLINLNEYDDRLSRGMDIQEIYQITGLTNKQIQALSKKEINL
jgi:hypothetical protein